MSAVVAPRRPGTAGSRVTAARPRHRGSALRRSQQRWGMFFAAAAVLGFVVFTLAPMVASAVISATDWTIGGSPTFTGAGNYRELVDDELFWKSLSATGQYAVLAVPGAIVVAFAAATLLNQAHRRVRSVLRTVFYLPVLVPPVATAVVWLWIFNPDAGLLNSLLGLVGLPPSPWVYGESTAVPSVALMTVWGFGNMALIFLAALQGVPRELYEAAECDGAPAWRRMWHVTLPTISPVILFNLVTGMIGAVQTFDAAYVMTQGGPNNATLFYVFYLYTQAFAEGRLGYASAMAWILFCIIVIITAVILRTSRGWVFYEGRR